MTIETAERNTTVTPATTSRELAPAHHGMSAAMAVDMDVTMTHLWSFEGAPLAHATADGWCELIEYECFATPRLRAALARARSSRLKVFAGYGYFDDTAAFSCSSATLIAELDATRALRELALACAREVVSTWPAPRVVRDYLATGASRLRAAAHHAAWQGSFELDAGERLAARAAMYAAFDDRAVLCARESSRLAVMIAARESRSAMEAMQDAQEQWLADAVGKLVAQNQRERAA